MLIPVVRLKRKITVEVIPWQIISLQQKELVKLFAKLL